MARGYLIPPEVEALIVAVHHNRPTWKPREVWMVARNILHERAEKNPKKYPDLPRKLNTGWPSLSSVRKIIKKEDKFPRNEPRKTIPSKDDPWSIATLGDYPIPVDAMPTVMSIYKRVLLGERELTIREVQWIARLYRIFDDLDLVWDWAWQYALSEWVDEITHNPFDTTQLDLELVRNPQYATIGRGEIERWGAIMNIAERHGADLDETLSFTAQFVASDMTLEEIEEIAKLGKYKQEAQHERKHKAKEQE